MKVIKWLFKHYKLSISILLCIIMVYLFLLSLKPRLDVVMNQCVEELFQEMIEKSIHQLDYQEDELILLDKNKDSDISHIQFHTVKLNQILINSLNTLNQSLDDITSDGNIRHQRISAKDWIDYYVPVGSLFKSGYFFGKGFEIPIRIQILQNLNGEIVTDLKPYGINATLVTISLSLELSAHAETFLGKKDIVVETSLPLVMQMVHGEVPDDYRVQN